MDIGKIIIGNKKTLFGIKYSVIFV